MRPPVLLCVVLAGCNHLQQLEFQTQRGAPVAAEPRGGHYLLPVDDLPARARPAFQEVRSGAEVVRAYFGRYQFEYDRMRGGIDSLEQTPTGWSWRQDRVRFAWLALAR